MTDLHEIPLPGLDGANPLGFLAALGTWRTTEAIHPGTRMYWKPINGHWAPVLLVRVPLCGQDLVEQLNKKLREGGSNLLNALNKDHKKQKDLKIPAGVFQKISKLAIKRSDFELCDWMSAIGSDAHEDKYGNIQGTLFDLMNAGKQYFLQTIHFLAQNTSENDLRNTLFEKWGYHNAKRGMRWDIEEDRRYALRWKDPQTDTTESQWGANRLGIEALPLLQTAPSSAKLETTCFHSKGKGATFFTWPIWSCLISLDTCRSLLGLTGKPLSESSFILPKMGVAAVYRSQRIWKGNPPNDYSNFCPAIQIS